MGCKRTARDRSSTCSSAVERLEAALYLSEGSGRTAAQCKAGQLTEQCRTNLAMHHSPLRAQTLHIHLSSYQQVRLLRWHLLVRRCTGNSLPPDLTKLHEHLLCDYVLQSASVCATACLCRLVAFAGQVC